MSSEEEMSESFTKYYDIQPKVVTLLILNFYINSKSNSNIS